MSSKLTDLNSQSSQSTEKHAGLGHLLHGTVTQHIPLTAAGGRVSRVRVSRNMLEAISVWRLFFFYFHHYIQMSVKTTKRHIR